MIDALRQELGVQAVPMGGFVGVNRGASVDPAFQRRQGFGFALEHEGKRAAIALAHDDDDAALAVLVDRKATVAAVFLVVRRLHVTAEIGAVHLDFAAGLHRLDFRREGFADFVGENESRLVLHVQFAGELQGAMTLHAVYEDRDGQEIVANRELTACEDRPAGHAVLMAASLALEQRARLVSIASATAALRANRLAFGRGPTDLLEGVAGFVVGHASDLRQRERASGGRKEEVLRHVQRSNVLR